MLPYIYDCIIVGAGASGLMCAASMAAAPREDFRGLILEATARPGTKLLMSGGGRCNITHAGSIKDFVPLYHTADPAADAGRFLRTTLYRHSNLDLMGFLEAAGLSLVTEEDGRVFPASGKAKDVLDLLLAKTAEAGFVLETGRWVTGLTRTSEGLWEVTADGLGGPSQLLTCSLVIASGGCSYPSTGSDGSLFHVLEQALDLPMTPLYPALTPLTPKDWPYGSLAGITMQGVTVQSAAPGRKAAREQGSVLFTDQGLSGPAALNLSRYCHAGSTLAVGWVDRTYEEVLADLTALLASSKAEAANLIADRYGLPRRFCRLLAERGGRSPKKLAALLTGDSFSIERTGSFLNAMVTAGGVPLGAVDPKTMELRHHPGCYVIGEALDADGPTGGYNLTLCWATAAAAADAVRR